MRKKYNNNKFENRRELTLEEEFKNIKVLSRVKTFTKCIDMLDDEICKSYPNRSELSVNILKNNMIDLCKGLIECLESDDNYCLVIEPNDDTARYITLEDIKGLQENLTKHYKELFK